MIHFLKDTFLPTSVQESENVCFIQFDNNEEKIIYLTLKKEKKSNQFFLYGEFHTVCADTNFHLFVLHIVDCIAEKLKCKFYVDDATGYLDHHSKEQLEQYINQFDCKPVVSSDLWRESVIDLEDKSLNIEK